MNKTYIPTNKISHELFEQENYQENIAAQNDDEQDMSHEFSRKELEGLEATYFPGEIIDCQDRIVLPHVTQLDLHTQLVEIKAQEEFIKATSIENHSNDLVEQFQLDSNHDYNKNENKLRLNFFK